MHTIGSRVARARLADRSCSMEQRDRDSPAYARRMAQTTAAARQNPPGLVAHAGAGAIRSADRDHGGSLHPFVCGCGRFHSSRSWEDDGWDVAADLPKLKLQCGCGLTIRKTEGRRLTLASWRMVR